MTFYKEVDSELYVNFVQRLDADLYEIVSDYFKDIKHIYCKCYDLLILNDRDLINDLREELSEILQK